MTQDQFRRDFQVPYHWQDDGVDHINIYSRGTLVLGRRLSHFASIPFDHPKDGYFASMEGFWYYIRNGRKDPSLRHMAGMEAKRQGKKSERVYQPNFRDEIMAANYLKIIQNPSIEREFVASELPFSHYYVFSNEGVEEMRIPTGADWLVDGFETLRREMKEGRVPGVYQRCQDRWNQLEEAQPAPQAMPMPQHVPTPKKAPPPLPRRDHNDGPRPPRPTRPPQQQHAPAHPTPSVQTPSLFKSPR